jgi:CubicO group peptidase (beta-lactamase class C family)
MTDASDTYDRPRAQDAGLDVDAVDALIERAHREIDAGLLPSCQLALARDGHVVVDVTLGDASPDSRYVIFSCTKAIVGAAVWRLLSDGRLTRDTKVVEVVPEFGTNGKDVITIEQLLTHTSGFPRAPLGAPAWADRSRRLEAFAKWKCNWDPGTRFEYHPTAAHWVLAEVVEAVTGTDYRVWIRDEVLGPLGLDRIQLGLPDAGADPSQAFADVRPVTIVGERPTPDELEEAIGIRVDLAALIGEVTSDAKVLLSQPDQIAVGVPGGGGVSTAADFALFYQGLLHNPLGLWSPEVMHAATAEVLCDLPDPLRGNPAHRTLGLILSGDDEAKAMRGFGFTVSGRAFGHDGAGGQIAYADPATGLSFCYFTDGHDEHLIREWRRTAGIASKAGVCAAPA